MRSMPGVRSVVTLQLEALRHDIQMATAPSSMPQACRMLMSSASIAESERRRQRRKGRLKRKRTEAGMQ